MNITKKLNLIFGDKVIRGKILFVFFILFIFRLLAAIPIPGVDAERLAGFISDNQFLGLLNIFSGGGFSSLSIVMLGVAPYITASIAMQLLTTVFPKLKEMYHEQGAAGRKKFAQISRVSSIPLAFFQGIGFLMLLMQQGVIAQPDIMWQFLVYNALLVTAGAALVMWLGELSSEYGIGNGVSLLIFAGIVASAPTTAFQLYQSFDPTLLTTYIAALAGFILVIAGVVFVSEAERPIPVTYAKQAHGGNASKGVANYIPIRVNQAGVMPIIFALSILLLPQFLFQVLSGVGSPAFQEFGVKMTEWLNNGLVSSILYFVLVFFFTYFYTAITFEPNTMAENLQKSGAFVPGVRPGQATEDYIGNIVSRITFIGALFLAAVAVLPVIMQAATGNQQLAIGGTAILIVVSVLLDIIKKIDAQTTMREY